MISMEKKEISELVQGEHDPALYQMFGIDREEFDERAQRGIDSALFRRWIFGEWADVQAGERELSNRQSSNLKKICDRIKYRNGIMAFAAVGGSYLLDNQVPPCIR